MSQILFCNKQFENTVRQALNVFDRPIFDEDVEKITELDLLDFSFQSEDFAILIKFKKLISLAISTSAWKFSFLKALHNLEDLYIENWNEYNICAFNEFKNLPKLKNLTVSGGTYSDIQFINLENLLPLNHLKSLSLHEFGFVNLLPLANYTQLESFYCGYGRRVANISVIEKFSALKSLSLLGLKLKNLDFLNALPNNLKLEICGLELDEEINVDKLRRFTNYDISEITVQGRMIIGGDGL